MNICIRIHIIRTINCVRPVWDLQWRAFNARTDPLLTFYLSLNANSVIYAFCFEIGLGFGALISSQRPVQTRCLNVAFCLCRTHVWAPCCPGTKLNRLSSVPAVFTCSHSKFVADFSKGKVFS